MLTLKKGQELNWFDLQYIESPLMAKRTVQSNHGTRIGGELVHNANEHGLPDDRSKVFDPYGAINNKLDNGQVFLVNTSTQMPVISRLDITPDNTAKWELHNGPHLMFLNAIDAALHRVQVPRQYGVLRDEPAKPANNQAAAQKTVREKHIFLLDLEGQNDRPLPPKYNITLVVENTTQSSLPVRQLKEVIYDSFSRVFTAEQGDAFKAYAITDSMLDVKKDLNENKTLAASEANDLIVALEETGVETRSDGVILHHVKYAVPVPLNLKVRYEFGLHNRKPTADVLLLQNEDASWVQAIDVSKHPKQVEDTENGWLTVVFEGLPENEKDKEKFTLYQQDQKSHGSPITVFTGLSYSEAVKQRTFEEAVPAPMPTHPDPQQQAEIAKRIEAAKEWRDLLNSLPSE